MAFVIIVTYIRVQKLQEISLWNELISKDDCVTGYVVHSFFEIKQIVWFFCHKKCEWRHICGALFRAV